MIAQRVRARSTESDEGVSLEELDEVVGFDADEVNRTTKKLREELGLDA